MWYVSSRLHFNVFQYNLIQRKYWNIIGDKYAQRFKISVIYITDGPDEPLIKLLPPKSEFFVGEPLTIQCRTVSNPPPVFTWRFQPHNKSEETLIKPSYDKSKLVFDSLKVTDFGTYICTGVNPNRSNAPNASAFIAVYVRNSGMKYMYHDCDQCSFINICQKDHGMTLCTLNTWVPIAMVFISLSTSLALINIILIWKRKTRQKRVETKKTVISQR